MNSTKKSILLVDDDEDDRLFFQEALDDLGNPVLFKSAQHGLDAINTLENDALPNAIFLDLNMPVLDGHECLKQIRSNPQYNDVKIIIYSTSYNLEVAEVLKEDGANYYIHKPSDYTQLKQTINNALEVLDSSLKHQNFLITI